MTPRVRRRELAAVLLALPWPFLAALLHAGGWPWLPQQVDLDVYLAAADRLAAGQPLYFDPPGRLPMIYPPFAAVLTLPLAAAGPGAAYLLWPLLNAALAAAVFARIGLRAAPALIVAAVAIALGGPLAQVFFLGQVGIFLMALCVLDLAPGPTLLARAGRWLPFGVPDRLLPAGVLTGVAAAIKLTPALFVVALVLVGRRRPALVAVLSAAGATMIGFAVRPAESAGYWARIATGNFPGEPDAPYQVTNQSLLAIAVRFLRTPELPLWLTVLLGGAVVALTLLAAVVVARAGEPMLALLLVGLGSTVAAPISWTHAYTWLAPIAVLALLRPLPGWLRLLAVGCWGWATWEPFQDLNVDTEVGLRLGAGGQLATAVGPLLGVALLAGCWWWARSRTVSRRPARIR